MYNTHAEYLTTELTKLNEHSICLEFGVGEGSSPIFNDYINNAPTSNVIAFESDLEWYDLISKKYTSERYIFNYIDDWDNAINLININQIYDLVFIDQKPWEARIQILNQLKDISKIIILHDYDYFNKGIIDEIYSVKSGSFFFEHYGSDFTLNGFSSQLPPTLVMINNNL